MGLYTNTPWGYNATAMKADIQSLVHIGAGSVLLFAIIGSLVFCLATGSMNETSHVMHQNQSSFSMHVGHVKVLSSAAASPSGFLSALLAILSVFVVFAFVMFSRLSPALLQPVVRRGGGYGRSEICSVSQPERRWRSRFVRSPGSLLPA